MTETKEELEKTLTAIRVKLQRIHDRETLAANRKLIGKCFKYPRNCYSCPDKPSDYWPVYRKIVGSSAGGLLVMDFETDKYGNIEIKPSVWGADTLCGYVAIKPSEFLRAWRRVQKRIASLNPEDK